MSEGKLTQGHYRAARRRRSRCRKYVPIHMISDAKDVYEQLKDLEAQAKRQERRIEILQHEFDALGGSNSPRNAAKGRLHGLM